MMSESMNRATTTSKGDGDGDVKHFEDSYRAGLRKPLDEAAASVMIQICGEKNR